MFFSGCTLGCVFCQNHEISAQGVGKPVSVDRLREIFRELIRQGAHNINLVTPGHFAPWVAQALEPSLPVPVVCNTGGYERVETLRLLEGKVQVYLPDMKYALSGAAAGTHLQPGAGCRTGGAGGTGDEKSVFCLEGRNRRIFFCRNI